MVAGREAGAGRAPFNLRFRFLRPDGSETWVMGNAVASHGGRVFGRVVEAHCNYFAPLTFPQDVEAGLRVAHVGRSSVRYEVALFAPGEPHAAAMGHFVHVYVDRATRRPVPLPDALLAALAPLRRAAAA